MQHEGATTGILIRTSGYGPTSYDFANDCEGRFRGWAASAAPAGAAPLAAKSLAGVLAAKPNSPGEGPGRRDRPLTAFLPNDHAFQRLAKDSKATPRSDGARLTTALSGGTTKVGRCQTETIAIFEVVTCVNTLAE